LKEKEEGKGGDEEEVLLEVEVEGGRRER